MCSEGFDVLEMPYYQYRQNRQGSITNTISSKNFYDLIKFVSESAKKLTVNRKANTSVNRAVMSFVAYEYAILLYIYARIRKEDKKSALVELKKYKWVLRYSNNPKTKIILFICCLFGVNVTVFLVGKIGSAVRK
jgi:hypothetical protein